MSDRFDFEQQIQKCWIVVDDLKDLDEGIFEGWIDCNTNTVSNHILGIANCYDIKFNKLWNQFETVFMELVRENKMLQEECAALRDQIQPYNPDTAGFGVAALKRKKKDK